MAGRREQITFNGILRALVSLAGAVAAMAFLLFDQLAYAVLSLLASYLLNGLLATMAFEQPYDRR